MSVPIPVYEAVEWREPAPAGGSQAQIFRLADGRFAVVKFPENSQGELVLANEFLSCQLAQLLQLPINRAVLVSIDERLLRLPRQNNQIPAAFSAGIRCGMIRFEHAEACQPADIKDRCHNSGEFHFIPVFEQLVFRQDGRQLLMFPDTNTTGMRFAAYDYGFAFGGQPQWSAASLASLAAPILPTSDPFSGQTYDNGAELLVVIERLRALTGEAVTDALMNLHPPRWGVTVDNVQALASVVPARAASLVLQFDQRHRKQLEAF